MTQKRRAFLRWSAAGFAGLVLPRPTLDVRASSPIPEDAWLDAIAGKKFRAFLDVGRYAMDGTPFRRAAALYATLHDHYGATDDDTGVAFGAHSTALAYLVSRATWDELGLVDLIAPHLNAADAASLRANPGAAVTIGVEGVRQLRAHGSRVLACRNTIARWARELSTKRGEPVDVLTQKLTSGLHEGVEPVPAMIAAAVMAQSRNVAYVAIE